MVRFLADDNFNINIVLGVRLLNSSVDIVRVQEVGITRAEDPAMLEWAAETGRVVLTHDADDMPKYAYERVLDGKYMPGVFEVRQHRPLGTIIEDILLLAECSLDDEWTNQVNHLPLR